MGVALTCGRCTAPTTTVCDAPVGRGRFRERRAGRLESGHGPHETHGRACAAPPIPRGTARLDTRPNHCDRPSGLGRVPRPRRTADNPARRPSWMPQAQVLTGGPSCPHSVPRPARGDQRTSWGQDHDRGRASRRDGQNRGSASRRCHRRSARPVRPGARFAGEVQAAPSRRCPCWSWSPL